MLHNDRLMIVVSLVIAVVVWAVVSFGPGNIDERQIMVQVKVDFTNTIAGYNDLRVIGEDTFTVTVSVQGPRSTIFNLTGDDIVVKPTLSDVQGPGKAELNLSASKAGKATGYSIISLSPSKVTVDCDYWTTADFPVAVDISQIKLENEKEQQIGDVVLDASALPNNIARLEGPRSTINKITSIVARVEDTHTISKTERFTTLLTALDENGAEVDLSNCQFLTPTSGTVDITVPVWVQKKVPLTYKLLHVPTGLKQEDLITLSLQYITLVGEVDVLETSAAAIADLGVIDFDHLTPDQSELTIALNVPGNIRVLEGQTVTATLNIGQYTTKTLSYFVKNISDVKVINLPPNKKITLQSQELTGIVVCGKNTTLRKISADDLVLTLDAGSTTGTGSVRYSVRITVPSHPEVWVYYGDGEQDGFKLFGTLE